MNYFNLFKNFIKFTKRYINYSKTKLNKNEIIVIHPYIKNIKYKKKKNDDVILDAQEALGLARSANFKIVHGISIYLEKLNIENENNDEKDDIKNNEINTNKNNSFDCENNVNYDDEVNKNEIRLNIDDIEKKIAESIIIKFHKMDSKFFFGKGKLNDISKYYLKYLTPYIFINTLLSPEQFRNLDLFFNNLLKSYQDNLYTENIKKNENIGINQRMYSDEFKKEKENEKDDNTYIMNNIENEIYEKEKLFRLYNNYKEIEKEEEYEEEEESIEDIEDNNEINIENINELNKKKIPLYVEIFDRYSIILYIFKKRAKNNLTKLQVELAKAKFIFNYYPEDNKTRIKYINYIQKNVLGACYKSFEKKENNLNSFNLKGNNSHLEYTTSFIKNCETYKEYEKRIIDEIFKKLKKELIKCKNNRILQNNARKHKASIAIIGYTNVGKTKLINYLTKSNLKAKNLLFQTLDTSYKNMSQSDDCYSSILIDSIGFIQNIPFSLYESFNLTLQEIKNADLIIHVIDITHPYKQKHKACVIDSLKNIGISDHFINNNIIEVWNKIDKLSEKEIYDMYKRKPKNVLPISAYTGTNCEILIEIIKNMVNKIKNVQVLTLQFETKEAKKRIEFLSKHYKVILNSISYSEDGNSTFIKLIENPKNLKKYYEEFKNT